MKRLVLSLAGLGLIALASGCCHHFGGGGGCAPNPCSPCGPFGAVGAAQPMSFAAAPTCSSCQAF